MPSTALRHAILPALLAATVACQNPAEPGLASFTIVAEGERDSIAPLVFTYAPGQLEVMASMWQPCTSYTASGTFTVIVDTLRIVATGDYAGDCPFDLPGYLTYRAMIHDLVAGEYWLRVENQWATNPDRMQIVVDRRVRVF